MAQVFNIIKKLLSLLEISKYFIGPLLFIIIANAEMDISWNGQLFLGIFSIVISLWLLTPVPLFISGIFGVALSVILGVVPANVAFGPFSSTVIFLFLGGFLLARSLEKTELDKLLAKKLLSHPWVSFSPQRTVFVFLGISFFLSMWISNTAAVAMLLPISYGVLKKLELSFNVKSEKFKEKFLIAIAFAATVGGNVTPIGSPPNVVALGLLKSINNSYISFLEWMAYATPFSLILFYFIYRHCISFLKVSDEDSIDENELPDFLTLSRNQKYVLAVFMLTVTFWFLPSLIGLFLNEQSDMNNFLRINLSAAVVSVFFASILHVVPFFKEEKILDSSDVSQIDWSSLLLFGAGLSLGSILFKTGGADYLMNIVKDLSGGMS
ncbi:SLC13 family permease, partial [Bacteriovoracaceae bacterium]|nr:SLC13 family permease [Bacteriovoracaceae bacterium]